MGNELMDFSHRVGNELSRMLAERARTDLSEVSENDRLTAMLGAALIAVAEVLREPVEKGSNLEGLMNFCSRWLRRLLEPVAGGGDR